jgi:hypothetical protein
MRLFCERRTMDVAHEQRHPGSEPTRRNTSLMDQICNLTEKSATRRFSFLAAKKKGREISALCLNNLISLLNRVRNDLVIKQERNDRRFAFVCHFKISRARGEV